MEIDVLRKRFMDTAVGDILRAIDGRSLIGSTTLAICVLDYLALISTRSKNERKDYEKIVAGYLIPINAAYDPKAVYALRCSLVHTYAESEALRNAGLVGFK